MSKRSLQYKHYTLVLLFIIFVSGLGYLFKDYQTLTTSTIEKVQGVSDNRGGLPSYTAQDLEKFNGTDPNEPIYVGYKGLVYDVTEGKKFYQDGGAYHFLAGRDATAELEIAGGGIIEKKYPVIGTLATDSK